MFKRFMLHLVDMNTPEQLTGFSMYQIIGFIVIFVIFASIVSYSKDLFVVDWSYFGGYKQFLSSTNERTGETTAYQPAPVPGSDGGSDSSGDHGSAKMHWCFVGEDNAGRWCLQVQDPVNCDKDRLFDSKNSCERLYSN